jgi:hypothetical protein
MFKRRSWQSWGIKRCWVNCEGKTLAEHFWCICLLVELVVLLEYGFSCLIGQQQCEWGSVSEVTVVFYWNMILVV